MSEGLIVIHGDVGNDPGAGMTGGRIIINGRCPTPPSGVSLRPLTAAEVKAINKQLNDEELHIP
jgi:glutamate synthase domain-containing protein 3